MISLLCVFPFSDTVFKLALDQSDTNSFLLIITTNCKNIMNLALFFVVIASILISAAHSQTSTFQYYFNTIDRYIPTYSVGYIPAGFSLMVNFTTYLDLSTRFLTVSNLNLAVETDSFPFTALTCTLTSLSPSSCYYTCPVTIAANYTVKLASDNMPSDSIGANPYVLQTFQLQVSSFLTNSGGTFDSSSIISTLVKATQTFRDRIARLIYVASSNQQLQFNLLQAPSLTTSWINLRLFKVNSVGINQNVFDIFNSDDILSNAAIATYTFNSANSLGTYSTMSPLDVGYYVLTVTYQPTNVNNLWFSFQSDPYPCPFQTNFPDSASTFQPCIFIQPKPSGYPCLAYDDFFKQCVQCQWGFSLINGTCFIPTTCPSRQFFHFGQCYPVSPNCDKYDAFTGACVTCSDPTYQLSNGSCFQPPNNSVVCGLRQYFANYKCNDVSALCKDFDKTNGNCINCIFGYQISDGACILVAPNCRINQYLFNGLCIDIPYNCVAFNKAVGKCEICQQNYYLSNGYCQLLICAPRQVISSLGTFCVNVSQLCDTYDPKTGGCLSCNKEDYILVNGSCIQTISPLAGCKQRQQLGFGPCYNPTMNCQTYNLLSGDCQQCLVGWYLDYKGECSLRDSITCRSDQTSIQGICVQRPQNCISVDANGLCTLCKGPNYQIQYGQCVYVLNCGPTQFLYQGKCVEVSTDCLNFNPSTGVCLTCRNGQTAVEGVCCPKGFFPVNGVCKDSAGFMSFYQQISSSVPTCIVSHPTMDYCLQCNQNYTVDPATMKTCY